MNKWAVLLILSATVGGCKASKANKATPPTSRRPVSPRWLCAAPKASGQIGLSWRLDDDTNRAGYNVYRSTTSGSGYVKINKNLITTTSYVDSGLSNGTTYYYAVRAASKKGTESPNSDQASATATSDTSRFCLASEVNLQLDKYPGYITPGDLNNDGYIDFLVSKWEKYKRVFDHKGNLLWEKFPNSPDGDLAGHGYAPAAIWDIDDDGKNEVLCQYYISGKYYLAVLDGATGNMETKIQLPRPFGRLSIANFRGRAKAQDVAVRFGGDSGSKGANAYACKGGKLSLLWEWKNHCYAHSPKPADVDGDGKDEFITGRHILEEDGTVKVTLPYHAKAYHTDSIMASNFGLGGPKSKVLISEEIHGRLYMYDVATKKVLWEYRPPRARTQSRSFHEIDIGDVRKDYPGYEIEVTEDEYDPWPDEKDNAETFLFTNDGKLIWHKCLSYTEEAKLIRWTGKDTLEVRAQKGIFDGHGRKIADGKNLFGRPMDLLGDYREEIYKHTRTGVVIYTNPTLNPASKPSPWEMRDLERFMEEYINHSFY